MHKEDYHFKGEPEDYLVIPEGEELNISALYCSLKRAKGLSIMLSASLDDDGDRLSDEILSEASWALEGLIKQALIITEGSFVTHINT